MSQNGDANALFCLIELAQDNQKRLDSFSNLVIAESLLNTARFLNVHHKRTVKKKLIGLVDSIANTTFSVSDCYKENGNLPDYATREKICERINCTYRELGKKALQLKRCFGNDLQIGVLIF